VNDAEGTRATITFSNLGVVAAFRDENSPRRPYADPANYDIERYLKGMPADLRKLSDGETLRYLLDKLGNGTIPVITSAFWEENSELVGNEPWDTIYNHGGHVIEIECQQPQEAMGLLQEDNEFDDTLMELIDSIYGRKSASNYETIYLTETERSTLLATAVSEEAIMECRRSFQDFGVIFSN